jgi:hypothetical protein
MRSGAGAGIAQSAQQLEKRDLIPYGSSDFPIFHCIHTDSGTRTSFYPTSTGRSLPGAKATGREADHVPPSGARIMNVRGYTAISPYVFSGA